jgi:membrane protein implicated in regulation of membrane protease activity
MSDPRILALFGVVFILLGSYNVYIGLKRINQARARGQQTVWYKQINLLTGIEYILLSVVFLMSIGLRSGLIPSSMRVITTPFYIVVLLVTAVMAFMVIRQAFANSRRPQTRTAVQSNGAGEPASTVDSQMTPEQRAAYQERRRERRRNAAAARRRRSGKA